MMFKKLSLVVAAYCLFLFAWSGVASAQVDSETSKSLRVDIQPEREKDKEARVAVDAQFQDASGDAVLDVEEDAELVVSVSNEGGKAARGVTLSVHSETSAGGLQIGSGERTLEGRTPVQVARLTELAPETNEQTTVPLRAPSSLPADDIRLAVEVDVAGDAVVQSAATITIPVGKTSSVPVVDRDIPETDMKRPDDIAVVIGNKEYKNDDIPDVDYAVRDAQIMKSYLTRTLGFREDNVIYVENASGAAMTRIFGTATEPEGQLYNWVKPGKSDVFVYYSGHGAPNPESGSPYFIPSNTNPSYLSQNGYPVNQLYENLATLPAESATVVLEACFSGTSEGGAVVQDISPAVLSVENPMLGMENGLAFTAGAADQVSTWYNEKEHGLFTYYFLKGLRGAADTDGDKIITASEMGQYVRDEVPYRARRMHNREQTPQVVGQNLDRVLVRYADSAPAAEPKATLPIATTDVQKSVKNALSLPDGAVKVESAANADGLQQGDVITTVNGTDLDSEDRLTEIVDQHDPGDTLELNIIREGKPRTVSVTLTASQ